MSLYIVLPGQSVGSNGKTFTEGMELEIPDHIAQTGDLRFKVRPKDPGAGDPDRALLQQTLNSAQPHERVSLLKMERARRATGLEELDAEIAREEEAERVRVASLPVTESLPLPGPETDSNPPSTKPPADRIEPALPRNPVVPADRPSAPQEPTVAPSSPPQPTPPAHPHATASVPTSDAKFPMAPPAIVDSAPATNPPGPTEEPTRAFPPDKATPGQDANDRDTQRAVKPQADVRSK